MANVLREHGIESKMDRYNLMVARGRNLKEFEGQTLEVRAYMIVEDTNKDGEIVKSLKFITKDGEVTGTTSPTYIHDVEMFLDFMETDELTTAQVVPKRTNSGKTCLTFAP